MLDHGVTGIAGEESEIGLQLQELILELGDAVLDVLLLVLEVVLGELGEVLVEVDLGKLRLPLSVVAAAASASVSIASVTTVASAATTLTIEDAHSAEVAIEHIVLLVIGYRSDGAPLLLERLHFVRNGGVVASIEECLEAVYHIVLGLKIFLTIGVALLV